MKYGKIDAAAHKLTVIEADDFSTAKIMCGLDPLRVDHGVVIRPGGGGIAIVVFEFGLFEPACNTHYFAIGSRLYAGNALLYAFDEHGETIDLHDPAAQVSPQWFGSAADVERAIDRGEIIRPYMRSNGRTIWEWPEARPKVIT